MPVLDPPAQSTATLRCYALVPAAGVGQRAGTLLPKQYAEVLGRSVIGRTLDAWAAVPALSGTLVVLAPDDSWFERVEPNFMGAGRWAVRCGGSTRAETVLAGLQALLDLGAAPDDWVLVHDAARCLVRPEWIERLVVACKADAVGGLLALPVADTLKAAHQGRATATVDRIDKWVAQTPQMFRIGMLREALLAAGGTVTDESSAMETAGHAPLLVLGDARNLKITWPQDFELAAALLGAPAPPISEQTSHAGAHKR